MAENFRRFQPLSRVCNQSIGFQTGFQAEANRYETNKATGTASRSGTYASFMFLK